MERQGEVQENFDHHNAWELDSRLERAMDALRCPPADANVENLSVAENAAWLCRFTRTRRLPLDEPTNHLDAESVLWLSSKTI
jgi:ATPase subunit of ABC transporter with duplicated ATPase domains